MYVAILSSWIVSFADLMLHLMIHLFASFLGMYVMTATCLVCIHVHTLVRNIK